MIEAFANNLGSHLGRHLFYWAVSQPEVNGLNLRLTELINKFHGPLERGVQVLDHLLTLEEEDFNGHWGSAYRHSYEPEYASSDGNQEVLQQPASSREVLSPAVATLTTTTAGVLAVSSGNNVTNSSHISTSNSNSEFNEITFIIQSVKLTSLCAVLVAWISECECVSVFVCVCMFIEKSKLACF